MRRFILTGAPGAGKTAIIRQLELDGFSVVEEAATDLIAAVQAQGVAQPWEQPSFIDAVADLQRSRLMRASCQKDEVQFHDRSMVCTAALAAYLGRHLPAALRRELHRYQQEKVFQPRVFFIRNLGYIAPTGARQISFEEALRFEKIHEETYRLYNFDLIYIEPGTLAQRVSTIEDAIR